MKQRTQLRHQKEDQRVMAALLNNFVSDSTEDNVDEMMDKYRRQWITYARKINNLKRGYPLKMTAFDETVKKEVVFPKKPNKFLNFLKSLIS